MSTSIIHVSVYAHSPVHRAIFTKDYASLRKILNGLPRFSHPSQVLTETASLAEEEKADLISSVIDRRDVPNRDTPLHLAVKLGEESATEMLMIAGADWSLQNELGWSALQEAICNRQQSIVKIIVRHYQPLAWAKWCRRLPRLIATMRRMRDFYMEITFHFESSVILFISRIAPSDTYRIWKRGANLRADMTLAGFDGFKIQRAEQSIVFLGDGSSEGDERLPPGTLCMISHKDKEVMNALDGAGAQATEEEVQQEVAAMSQTNIIRPGLDVTQAVLLPQLTWRRQEKTELVGVWKSRVYEMHNVVVSIKSRKVPGAMTDEELFSSCNENNETESEEEEEERQLDDILTEEERRQLEVALKFDSSEVSHGHEENGDGFAGHGHEENGDGFAGHGHEENGDGFAGDRHSFYEARDVAIEEDDANASGDDAADADGSGGSNSRKPEEKKGGWFGSWRRGGEAKSKENKGGQRRNDVPPRRSVCVEEKVGDPVGEEPPPPATRGENITSSSSTSNTNTGENKKNRENEYKKGLRPVLWLSSDFPLRTEEILPLLDILANKVKAIRRLRELLTTKLPLDTFPVKVAIPVIPTIRVLVTFTKFEELQAMNEEEEEEEEEFSTPPSSPSGAAGVSMLSPPASGWSWFQWIKSPYERERERERERARTTSSCSSNNRIEKREDPFAIPRHYQWVTVEAKMRRRMQEKSKPKKNRGKKEE